MTAQPHNRDKLRGKVGAPARRTGFGVTILLCLPVALTSSIQAQDAFRVGPELALPSAPDP